MDVGENYKSLMFNSCSGKNFNVWCQRKKGFEILIKSTANLTRREKTMINYIYTVWLRCLACELAYEILTKHELTDQIIYQTDQTSNK